jgi:hypothetical protein
VLAAFDPMPLAALLGNRTAVIDRAGRCDPTHDAPLSGLTRRSFRRGLTADGAVDLVDFMPPRGKGTMSSACVRGAAV